MRALLLSSSLLFISLSLVSTISCSSSSSTSYQDARNVRIKSGHIAAVPLYQELLQKYGDVTAATRIAASPHSTVRHDMACPLPRREEKYLYTLVTDGSDHGRTTEEKQEEKEGDNQDGNGDHDEICTEIRKLKGILQQSGYNCHEQIQKLFGVKEPLSISSFWI